MLYKERSTNGAGIHFILIGLMIFIASWQVIKIVEYHEVKKATEVESRRLSTLISGRLMTDINDIRALYSKANHQNHTTYQAFVGYLNDYFRKMHSLESITFYYNVIILCSLALLASCAARLGSLSCSRSLGLVRLGSLA